MGSVLTNRKLSKNFSSFNYSDLTKIAATVPLCNERTRIVTQYTQLRSKGYSRPGFKDVI